MTAIIQGVLASIGGVVQGQEAFTTVGTFTWVAPAGVTKVSVVAVGAGGVGRREFACCVCFMQGGYGGGLGYKNNYSVTPGSSYTVEVGGPSAAVCGAGQSFFVSAATVRGGKAGYFVGPGTFTGDGGGYGAYGGVCSGSGSAGGGGAGGYSNGANFCCGAGSRTGINSTAGTGGKPSGGRGAGGGGGVGILGQGTSGAAQTVNGRSGFGGSGGSGNNVTRTGELYGGGGASDRCFGDFQGAQGAVRIIWPGCARSFPSTNTGNV